MRRVLDKPIPPGQLVLGRKVGECVRIQAGDVVGEVTIVEIRWQRDKEPMARVAFRFPKGVVIMRAELKTGGNDEAQD